MVDSVCFKDGENFDKKKCCSSFDGELKNGKCFVDKFNLDIDGTRGQSVFSHKSRAQEFKSMSPDEFLHLVPKDPFETKERDDKIKKIIEDKKSPMDPLNLDVDVDSCKVLSHEGRGRSRASKRLGIKKLPVVIFNKEFSETGGFLGGGGYFHTDRKNKCERFKPQNS